MKLFPKILVLGNSLSGSRDGGGVVRTEDEVPESLKEIPCIIRPLVFRLRMRGARLFGVSYFY